MAAEAGGSALGPALFVGLSLFALVTQGEPEIDPNPASRHPAEALAPSPAPAALRAALPVGWNSPADLTLVARSAALLQNGPAEEGPAQAQPAPARPVSEEQLRTRLSQPSPMAAALPLPPPNRATQLRAASQLAPAAPLDQAAQRAPRAARPDLIIKHNQRFATPAPTGKSWSASRPDRQALTSTPAHPPLPAASTAWSPAAGPIWFRLTGDRVHLRAEPSLQSPPIALFPVGSFAAVTGAEGKWLLVDIAGQSGWIWASYLAPVAPQ